jgi:hypothetical protein
MAFAARNDTVATSVAAVQQQERVRSCFRIIAAQFNPISRQRQCLFNVKAERNQREGAKVQRRKDVSTIRKTLVEIATTVVDGMGCSRLESQLEAVKMRFSDL